MQTICWILLVGAAMLGGCASQPAGEQLAAWQAWAKHHGGLMQDDRTDRIQKLGAAILPPQLAERVQFHVLDQDDATAFAGHDGHIFVTRALIDRLDDAELTAAISHELGHLVIERSSTGFAALRGTPGDLEMRADAAGVTILEQHGLGASDMARMLQNVHDMTPMNRSCRLLMEQRIAVLTSVSR